MKKSVAISFSLFLHLFLIMVTFTNESEIPDLCHPNPCKNGGSCTVVEDLEGEYPSCSCIGDNDDPDNFCNPAADDEDDEESNPCDPNPCQSDGDCFPDPYHILSSLDFKCMCGTDREGDRCEIETGRPKDDFHPFP